METRHVSLDIFFGNGSYIIDTRIL